MKPALALLIFTLPVVASAQDEIVPEIATPKTMQSENKEGEGEKKGGRDEGGAKVHAQNHCENRNDRDEDRIQHRREVHRSHQEGRARRQEGCAGQEECCERRSKV